MTVGEAVALLRGAGVASPDHDARALLRFADDTRADYDELVRRRAAREPLQHLLGSTGFRYLELRVGPGVFIPRPETEVVVGAALDALRDVTAPVVADLCAGAGTIGYAVAQERPDATVHLVELDESAYEWLARNRPGRNPRVHLHRADAAVVLTDLDGTLDLVASNPPYVAEDERELVDPEVREHDPSMALFAGADGLDVIRRITPRALALLKPGGRFVVEHSDRQGETAPQALRDAGFADVADHLDLTGRPRFATGTKPC